MLSELLLQIGKKAHVVSLDGWLNSLEISTEGNVVLNRYNLIEVHQMVKKCIDNPNRLNLKIPKYNRLNRKINHSNSISVGPSDVIIIEGVPALMDSYLCSKLSVRLYVDVKEAEREKRLLDDYECQKINSEQLLKTLDSRKIDELPDVRKSSSNLAHKILN